MPGQGGRTVADTGPKVVVIGGGVIGASCLYHLAERGITDAVLLEKDHLCSGSSGRSAGVVETQYLTEEDVVLRARSMPLFERFAREDGLPFVRHGYLRLGRTPGDLTGFRRSVETQRRLGIAGPRVLDPDGISELVPGLVVGDVAGGLFGPGDGYIDPHRLVGIFARRAQQRGARVLQGTAVTGLAVRAGRVRAVLTTRGEFPGDVFVNAAGPWAAEIGAMAGLTLPVAGYRRQIVVFQPPEPPPAIPFVIDYVPGAKEPGVYFRDETGGLILAGLHQEGAAEGEEPEDPDRFNPRADWGYVRRLAGLLRRRYPPAEAFGVRDGWAGLYPITPDGQPIIGPVPGLENLINAIGFGGVGIQVAPAVGQVVAAMVAGGPVPALAGLERYRLERFWR